MKNNVDLIIAALRDCSAQSQGYGAPDEVLEDWAKKLGFPVWKLVRLWQLSCESFFEFEPDFIAEAVRIADLPKTEFLKVKNSTPWLNFYGKITHNTNTQMIISDAAPIDLSDFCLVAPDSWRYCKVGKIGESGSKLKQPFEKSWQTKTYDKHGIKTALKQKKCQGFGLVAGDGLILLDVDGELASARLKEVAGSNEIPATVGWTSGKQGRFQLAFNLTLTQQEDLTTIHLATGGKPNKGRWYEEIPSAGDEVEQLDFRYAGHQSVLPPSPHPDTAGYTWLEGQGIADVDVAEMPDWLFDYLLSLVGKVEPVTQQKPTVQLPLLSSIPIEVCIAKTNRDLLDGTLQGGRNDSGAKLARDLIGTEEYLLQAGYRVEQSARSLFDRFCAQCSPAIDSSEAEQIWRSAEGDHPGPCLSGDKIENCVKGWQRRNGGSSPISAPTVSAGKESSIAECYEITDAAATPDHHLNKYFFKEGEGDYCTMDGAWFHHNGENAWNHIEDEEMQKTISGQLKKLYIHKVEKRGKEYFDRYIYQFGSDRYVNSAFRFNLKDLAVPFSRRPNPNRYLNFLNGVLDIETNKFEKYDRSLYLTSQIQADYSIASECPDDFQKFIDTAYGHEKTELIRAVIRYFIDPSIKYGLFVHLIGPSGSGKGTLIRAIGNLLGKSYKALSEFSVLNSAEGRHQHLTGARMVAFPDVTNALTNLGAFYELVDNGALSGRPLFSGTAFTKEWNARFILGSTQPMAFEKSDTGWDRRCIPISTIARQDAIDRSWADKLDACMGQVVGWAMGLKKEETMEILSNPVKFAPDYQQLKDIQSITSDSVQAFIDSCLAPDVEAEPTTKTTVYGYYKAFCDANKLGAKGFTNFCARMKATLGELFESPRSSKRRAGSTINVPASFKTIVLSDDRLFSLKAMPSGEELPMERAEYVCNPVYQGEGGLEAFRVHNKEVLYSVYAGSKKCMQDLKNAETLISQESQLYSGSKEIEINLSEKEDADLPQTESENANISYIGGQKILHTPETPAQPTFQDDREILHTPETPAYTECTPGIIPMGTKVCCAGQEHGVIVGFDPELEDYIVRLNSGVEEPYQASLLEVVI
jgi:phage/plasmid-associated DNA primase